MKKFITTILLLFIAAIGGHCLEPDFDTDGNHINAHGGCIIRCNDRGLWYWYGEERDCNHKPQIGISAYSSPDLLEWTFVGTVLPAVDSIGHPLELGCVMERPKVVFCPSTGKYVMWFHHELTGRGYAAAQAAVAVADNPEGPFIFLRSGRVNPGKWPENLEPWGNRSTHESEWWSDEWRDQVKRGKFTARDLEGGQMARDMTLFVDDDGKAYHIYSSEENLTIHIAELTPDFTAHTGRYVRVDPAGHNEAPMVVKTDSCYLMVTSGCTGWKPNEARLLRSTSMMGEWERLTNPCRGKDAATTFNAQGAFIFKNDRSEFVADFDRWDPHCLRSSGHLWVPVRLTDNRLELSAPE